MNEFIYLHSYSAYSILKSGMSVDDYVLALKKRGYNIAGLSDFSYFFGQPRFFKIAKENGLKPLLGIDLIYDNILLTFYPKNEVGYRALLKIAYLANNKELSDDLIKKEQENLVLIIANKQAFVEENFKDNPNLVRDVFKRFTLLVDTFYIGLETYSLADDLAKFTREFATKFDYKLVAFPHVKYVNKDDAISLELARAISENAQLGDLKKQEGVHYLYSLEELKNLYEENEIATTLEIANFIDFDLNKMRGELLKFPIENGMTSKAYIEALCEAELKRLALDKDPYKERLAFELETINNMGYNDYFLIVSDFVKFAKSQGILVGPGRGSAAGSLVAYLLHITSIDPLKYDLLFERFLNPQRQSMPDIDIDFMDIRREEVVEYLKQKYGENRICNIVTFQTNAARASIRDVGRIYNVDLKHINLLTKSLGQTALDLRDSYRKIKSFKTLVDSDPFYLEIVSLASKIEGFPRQTGLHAAGLVLNNEQLIHALPIFKNNNINISQYEMEYLEAQGFLKMDLLGLTNLSTIDTALKLIELNHGVKLDYETLPYEEPEIFKLIAKEQTMGIFQLESQGMLRAIRQIKPTEFNDIVAVLALFRPGPMENIPIYAERKEKGIQVQYLNKELEEILAPTYGIIVYQEQIMQIVRVMAGFSYAEADMFRRAISKKNEDLLNKLEKDFLEGATKNGYSLKDAKKTFDDIHKFADYGFNKSHSVAYAKLACQMAYLKVHYPLEFYAAILDRTTSSDAKFPQIISEMKERGINLLLPSVNDSVLSYKVNGSKMRLPMNIIKGFSADKASRIIRERTANGPYTDLANFLTRMNFIEVTKNDLRLLCEGGALDEFGYSRNTMLNQVDNLDLYKNYSINAEDNFLSPIAIDEVKDDKAHKIKREIELIGLAISDNPLHYIEDKLKHDGFTRIASLNEKYPKIYGYIKVVKLIKTRNGDQMAFITLSDYDNEIDVTVFPNIFSKYFNSLSANKIIGVKGNYQIRDERPQIVANEIIVLEEQQDE